jgi:hypothetical protein
MKQYFQKDNKWVCSVCNKDFNSRQATTSHIHRSHTNPGVSYGGHTTGTPAWNKGLVGVQTAWNKGLPGTFTGKTHTAETKAKISKKLSVNNKGGRCKWYTVAGQSVQGTWEQNAALKFEELGIKWTKLKTNQHTFEYEMNGKVRCYTPDFYLPEQDVYLELKGRWWGDDKEKMSLVLEKYKDKKIVVIEKDNYEKLLRGELVW